MIEITDFEEVTRFKMSRTLDGKPLYWVAAYLIDGLLVDTGCSYTADELADCLEGRNVSVVVNTHHHEDHVGGNRTLIERFGIPVLAHPDSVPRIGQVPILRSYQEYVWGYPEPVEVSALGKEVLTEQFRFDVLETPGHCEGHVALVELERGWCFSGDIFITEKPKVIRADEDVAGLISSMRLLAALPTERLVLFTSMGEIIPDGRRALLSCVEYLGGLQKEASGLEAQGFTPEEIRERLFGEGSSLATLTGGHFSSDNLIKSLLAKTATKSE